MNFPAVARAIAHLEEANDIVAVALRQWNEFSDDPPTPIVDDGSDLQLITSSPVIEPLAVVGSLTKLINKAIGSLETVETAHDA